MKTALVIEKVIQTKINEFHGIPREKEKKTLALAIGESRENTL